MMARPRKLSRQQAQANAAQSRKDWDKKHPAKRYRYQKKSRAKGFILHDATAEELDELESYIKQRREEIAIGKE